MNEQIKSTVADWSASPLDREIVVSRVVNADRPTVFQAWTDHDQIVKWFGPDGFECKTHEIDIRTGGVWRFDMHAPDVACFSNRMDFVRVEAPRVIEAIHGKDADDPDRFRLLVIFDVQDDGKTVVTIRQIHPTPERRKIVVGFGAVELGGQTLSKLAALVESS
ncbi:SRPBCC domain-containing protein [Leisingera sp.]|uniref:SRPBCC domain-containing protein n=1 Tax=Leisingera sp. TaxID=1879318 RepID=UPI002B278C7B|nr:SRPBCC domain-containing protein [Leisingera sp.]